MRRYNPYCLQKLYELSGAKTVQSDDQRKTKVSKSNLILNFGAGLP